MADVYFDFSAEFDGDGTIPAHAPGAGLIGAFNTLAGRVQLEGDTWWLRRTTGAAGYDNISFSIGSQERDVYEITVSPDGTKLFLIGPTTDRIYQYTMSTPYDISTMSYDNKSFLVSGQDATPRGLVVSQDGTKMYMAGYSSEDIYQYTMSTPFDVSTMSYDGVSLPISAQDSSPAGLALSPDGTKLYLAGYQNDRIYQYTMSTPLDITTASFDAFLSVSGQEGNPSGLTIKPDGTKLFMVEEYGDKVHQYTMSTGFDISTASYDNKSLSVVAQDNTPRGVSISTDGTKLLMAGATSDSIYQYTLETAFDLAGSVDALSENVAINVAELKIAGWPLAGDVLYEGRPVAGISEGWDSDISQNARINFSSSSYSFSFGSACISGNVLARLVMNTVGTAYNYMLTTNFYSRGILFENMQFNTGELVANKKTVNLNGSAHNFVSCTMYGYGSNNQIYVTGNGLTFDSCRFVDINSSAGTWPIAVSGNRNIFKGCAFDMPSTTADGWGLYITGKLNQFIGVDWNESGISELPKLSIKSGAEGTKILGLGASGAARKFGYIEIEADCCELELSNILLQTGIFIDGGDNNKITIDGVSTVADTIAGIRITGDKNTLVLKDYDSWAAADVSDTGKANTVYSLNHGGLSGFWKAICTSGTVESSVVVRTGGAAFSLFCEATQAAPEMPTPNLGVPRVAEVAWVSLVSGANTVKIYGAHKRFTVEPSKVEIVMEVEYRDADDVTQIVTTAVDGDKLADASVWTGDTDLTAFRLELPVTVPVDQVCPVRIKGHYVDALGKCFYIDPAIEVV